MSSPRPVRVCLVSPLPPPYGGISHWTRLIASHARSRRSVVFTHVDTAPRNRAVYELSAVRRVLQGAPQIITVAVALLREMRLRRPDVVHLNTSGQLALARDLVVTALARLHHVPVVYHLRFGRVPEALASGTAEGRLLAFVARRVHTVIAIDPGTKQALQRYVPGAQAVFIPNCIDLDSLPALPEESRGHARTVVFVGWVVPTKGTTELVEAWSSLETAGWRLVIAGPGDPAYVEELRSAAAGKGTVDFTGEVEHDEALRLIAAADVFVLPSHTEGFPNVILEAMALGRPIIATDVGAIGSMLDDGCGVVVPARSTAALASALSRLLDDADERRDLGAAGLSRAREMYALDTVFDRYERLWRDAGHVVAGPEG